MFQLLTRQPGFDGFTPPGSRPMTRTDAHHGRRVEVPPRTLGRTFRPRTRIPTLGSARPTHPQIVVVRRGRIVVAWDELLNGQRLAAAREVSKPGQRVGFWPVITLSPGKPATYPVLAAPALASWRSGRPAATRRPFRPADLFSEIVPSGSQTAGT